MVNLSNILSNEKLKTLLQVLTLASAFIALIFVPPAVLNDIVLNRVSNTQPTEMFIQLFTGWTLFLSILSILLVVRASFSLPRSVSKDSHSKMNIVFWSVTLNAVLIAVNLNMPDLPSELKCFELPFSTKLQSLFTDGIAIQILFSIFWRLFSWEKLTKVFSNRATFFLVSLFESTVWSLIYSSHILQNPLWLSVFGIQFFSFGFIRLRYGFAASLVHSVVGSVALGFLCLFCS